MPRSICRLLPSNEALELLRIRAAEDGCQRIEREHEEALRLVADVEGLPVALVLLGCRQDGVNVIASVEYLRQACVADPSVGFGLGYGLIRLGDLSGAR